MRRLLIALVVALVLPTAISAQEMAQQTTQKAKKPSWRKTDDGYWDRKNLISLGVSVLSFNSFDEGFAPVTISYDRKLRHNVTIGGLIDVSHHFFNFSTDDYEVHDVVGFLGAKAGYDLKIARNIYFRFGLGAGIGIHRIYELTLGCMSGDCGPLPPFPATRVLPQLFVDMHWVFRVGRNMELMVAPLGFSPSQFIFSPWDDEYYSGGYYSFNLAPVRLGVKF